MIWETFYFANHVNEPLQVLADLMRRGQPATDIMAWYGKRDRQSMVGKVEALCSKHLQKLRF